MTELATSASKLTPANARRCLDLLHQARGAMACWLAAYCPTRSTEVTSRSAWQPQVAAAAIADTIGTAHRLVDELPSLDLLQAQGLVCTTDAALSDAGMLRDGPPPMEACVHTMRMAAGLVDGFVKEFGEDLELVAAAVPQAV